MISAFSFKSSIHAWKYWCCFLEKISFRIWSFCCLYNVESIFDYSKAIELDPKDSYLYFFRGMSYDYLNLNEEALKNMKISVELDPHNELAVDMVNYLEGKWIPILRLVVSNLED